MDTPIAKAPPDLSNVDDGRGKCSRLLIGHGWMAVAVTREPHKTTGAALGQIELHDDLPYGLALDLWG